MPECSARCGSGQGYRGREGRTSRRHTATTTGEAHTLSGEDAHGPTDTALWYVTFHDAREDQDQ
ncbi:hypothetical protein DEI92_13935 [Curtobacterium sp. MCBD17_034]|nr:hypothetical protein DEI92_13935 [Curtobacterium sp. MCBD17_034]PZM33832.1 hypothetical protein DEI90_11320 [Curtobacterium sp. MCBD17_031]